MQENPAIQSETAGQKPAAYYTSVDLLIKLSSHIQMTPEVLYRTFTAYKLGDLSEKAQAQEELVAYLTPLVLQEAFRGGGISLEENISVAFEGALRALQTYKMSTRVHLSAWARLKIQEFLRDKRGFAIKISYVVYRAMNLIWQVQSHEKETPEELFEKILQHTDRISIEVVREALAAMEYLKTRDLQLYVNADLEDLAFEREDDVEEEIDEATLQLKAELREINNRHFILQAFAGGDEEFQKECVKQGLDPVVTRTQLIEQGVQMVQQHFS